MQIGNHHKVDVSFKTGNLLEADVDVFVVSCDSQTLCSQGLFLAIKKRAGRNFLKALESARNQQLPNGVADPGEILVVDLSNTNMKQKYMLMAVKPDEFHASVAYRNVIDKTNHLNCTSVAIPGLGCGGLGLDKKLSSKIWADVFCVLMEGYSLDNIERVVFIDIRYDVINAFETTFNNKFGTSQSNVGAGTMDPFREYVTTPAEINVFENCVVCYEEIGNDPAIEIVQLKVCQHQFHAFCFKSLYENTTAKCCPTCKKYYAMAQGNMPKGGTMKDRVINNGMSLEGGSGYIEISYNIPGGVQGPEHIRPGVPFLGTTRQAYLPNTDAGRKVLKLFHKAFECRLTFTVGDSVTTGARNVVVWNNIHHKTNLEGGSSSFGYPDSEYLARVTDELKAVGITEDML